MLVPGTPRPYEIVAPTGAGGSEVFRATDTKLNRGSAASIHDE
jgi:hypothetical protein